MLHIVSYGEASRWNITVNGMEYVRDARFCGVKVCAHA